MAQDPELTAEQGRDVTETTRTAGWKLISAALKERIENREDDRRELAEEMGTQGQRDVETLTLQMARISGELEGLRALEDITSTMLRKKAVAEKQLRDHE